MTASPALAPSSAPRNRPDIGATAQIALGVESSPREVGRVRKTMAKALGAWGVTGLADDVLLVVSELVTNAVQHALGSEIAFVATCGDGHVLIEASDASTAAPAKPRAITDNAEDGRGLALVEALASDWGWTPHEDGTKSTWAVIAISAEEREYADCHTGTGVRP